MEAIKKKSLLEQALTASKARKSKPISQEQLDLVQAWLDDKITTKQVSVVIGNAYAVMNLLALGAKQLYNEMRKSDV